ncbi:Chitinase 1 [Sphaceloma murrayae]|uniref:chitinase n=1 Tax=Sphaceloma murrayae TaxID=2082308 RepID=A0A2K1QMD1_9PEZI|nr:Chitinase 1 [Sphaceloma murrayae]
MSRLVLAATVAASLVASCVADFAPQAKNNVAVYWGQGAYQARLVETCKNPNVDVVIIGYVNVFPDQGSGGYPGTYFGNACGTDTFKNKAGKQTQLLSKCPDIGPDITACQTTYGKKVLLSLGGNYQTNYFIGNDQSAVSFANFLWGAFGPKTTKWTNDNGPRPFGDAVVDGFDFDIESELAKAPTFKGKPVNNYRTRGYVKMIQTLKNQLYPTDKSKTYFISGSPQCIVPDAHFAQAVSNAWFDWLFIQFYNTPICSARAGVNFIEGASSIDISYTKWSQVKFFNKNAKIYIGVPGSSAASNSLDYYLPPKEADLLINKYYKDSKFGGIMLWEATYAKNNVVCGKNYPTWIKQILNATQTGSSINTITNDCPSPKVKCGTCAPNPVSTDGRCGPNFGSTCAGSSYGPCCSIDGYCSSTYKVCSSPIGCDSQYADCDAAAQVQPARLFKRQEVEALNTSTVPSNMSSPVAASPAAALATTESVNTTTSEVPVNNSSAPTTAGLAATVSASATLAATGTETSSSSSALTATETNGQISVSPEVAQLTTGPEVPSSTESALESPSSPTPTEPAAQRFATITVISTITSTVTEGEVIKVITTTVPFTTTLPAEEAATVFSSTTSTCAPEVTSCSDHPESQTITHILTSTVYGTVTVPGTVMLEAGEETTTSYSTAYHTTIVNLAINPDHTLFNPHADDADTTRTTTNTRTETIRITETVTPRTTTASSTTTVVQYVTVAPVAKFASGKGEVVNRVKASGGEGALAATVDAAETTSASAAVGANKAVQQQQTGAGGRLSPRERGSWAKVMAAAGFVELTNSTYSTQTTTSDAMTQNDAKNSVTGAATAATSTLGNLVGGVARTAGGTVGAVGRGLGDTITNTTGNTGKPLGDALNSLGNGVQDGTNSVAKGVENAGQGKKAW